MDNQLDQTAQAKWDDRVKRQVTLNHGTWNQLKKATHGDLDPADQIVMLLAKVEMLTGLVEKAVQSGGGCSCQCGSSMDPADPADQEVPWTL